MNPRRFLAVFITLSAALLSGPSNARPEVVASRATARERLVIAKVDPQLIDQVAKSAAEIDRLVLEKLREAGQRPNEKSSDAVFVRRIYLDITGAIPPLDQTTAFLNDRSSHKRAQLIDRLLESPGYLSHSFNYWADIFRLKDQAANINYLQPYNEWIKANLASDMPYDEMVREMLTAEGRVWENPAVGHLLRDPDMPLASLDNTVRIFLGTQIGCAQCHDHPFDEWTQKEFYELAAFVYPADTSNRSREYMARMRPKFRQAKKSSSDNRLVGAMRQLVRANTFNVADRDARQLKLPDDYAYTDGRAGEYLQPRVILTDQPDIPRGARLREVFAEWLTSPDNPRFTLTIANRLWARALGRGVIPEIDNILGDTAPTNGPLMELLVAEMQRVKYSQKEFLRILYNTDTYQHEAYAGDVAADTEYFFPGPLLRRLTAEQVWDSLLVLTSENVDEYQRPSAEELIRLVALQSPEKMTPDQLLERTQVFLTTRRALRIEEHRHDRTVKGRLPAARRASELPMPLPPDHFLRQFSQGDRELISGGSVEGNVPQILTMFNGEISHRMLREGTVIYDNMMAGKTPDQRIDAIFLSVLSRTPTRAECKVALDELHKNELAGYGNVIWALLNTTEFLFIQ